MTRSTHTRATTGSSRARRRSMTRDDLLALALAMPGAWADQPWQDDTVVKVGSRIFVFVGAEGGTSVTLRCRPEDVEAWRQRYPDSLGPAPYMRTKPWNRVELDGTVAPDDVVALLEESYDCVVERLTRKERPAGWVPPEHR